MRNRQLETLIQQSTSAMRNFVIWFVIALAGFIWLMFSVADPPYNAALFVVPLMMTMIGAFIAILHGFAYARYNELMHQLGDNEPPAHDMLDFEQATMPPDTRLISRDPQNPKRIILAGQYISMRKWRRLASTLAHYNWRFTRDVLHEAGTFTSLSKNWPQIHADFIRLGWVIGNDVTEAGKAAIQAENPPTLNHID